MKRYSLFLRLTALLAVLGLLWGCSVPGNEAASGSGITAPALSTQGDPDVSSQEPPEHLLRVSCKWYSSATGGEASDEICFTDDWFFADPAIANPALALCSMQIEAVCGNTADGTDILEALGFTKVEALHYAERSFDHCACTVGEKRISRDGADCTLRAVFIQGIGYDETGWEQNVLVNGDEATRAHWGYLQAVDQLLSEQAPEDSGPVIWWIVGYSRGGGIANLFAARLAELGQTVFGYTFEAPAVIDADQAESSDIYAGIHNYLCDDDLVPMVPLWGMVRCGQDHSLSTFSPQEVTAALQERNPAAYEAVGKNYDGMWTVTFNQDGSVSGGVSLQEYLRRMTAGLEAAVPSRADYAAPHTDPYTLNGTSGEILWSPQEAMVCLVRTVYSGKPLPYGSAEEAAPLLRELIYGQLEAALAAQTGDEAMAAAATGRRWQLARSLHSEIGGEGVTPEGLYGLIVLLSPLLVRSDSVLAAGALPELDAMAPAELLIRYAPEALNFLSSGDELVFSHHTDTLILRLHLLCRD